MAWIILIAVLFGLVAIGLILDHKDNRNNEGWGVAALCLIVVGGILLVAVIAHYIDYIQFEKTFEIQRAMLTTINENIMDIDRPYIVADIINANETLAKYQGGEMMWGIWNLTPARVMDILPIGVG